MQAPAAFQLNVQNQERFDEAREAMIEDGSYVGNMGYDDCQKFTWIKENYYERLVVETSEDIHPFERESFEFSMIVDITYGNFFLNWNPSNQLMNQMRFKAKGSCLGQAPCDTKLASDYRRAMENIENLMGRTRHEGYEQNGVIMSTKTGDTKLIKFRHILFGELPPDDSEDESPTGERYRLIPLWAYDIKGKLIKPDYYKEKLQGATVLIKFTLMYYEIRKANQPPTDGYAADIRTIEVLATPNICQRPDPPATNPRFPWLERMESVE